jgi:hypothetical protein
MDMKKLLESLDECGAMEDGMPPMAPPMPRDDGDPVSMNVSLNARGKEHVADLIDMMKNAGLKDAEPVSQEMMPMRTDIERLRDIVDGPKDKDMDDLKPGTQKEPCPKCGKVHIGMSSCNDSIENDEESVDEYANEPDEDYRDEEYMTKDIAGGLNREKARGAQRVKDPAIGEEEEETLEQQILRALQDDYVDFKEGDAEDKGDEEECPECGSTKKKLMACSSCGCK